MSPEHPSVSEAEIHRRIDLVDGALGAAGHQISDAESRSLLQQVAAETITVDEAIAQVKSSPTPSHDR